MALSQVEKRITIDGGGEENVLSPRGEESNPIPRAECTYPRRRGEGCYPKRRRVCLTTWEGVPIALHHTWRGRIPSSPKLKT